ncbi:MAG: NAD(P)H-hydrate dehydratase [Bacteroidia bacterium]|nr:NAD(P)H-hydrate dehydratase [Bacteroidia bacterium]
MMELILNAEQIKKADNLAMEIRGISSIQLMEDAANAWTLAFLKYHQDRHRPLHVFCGPGNNGGDGLVIVRLLHRFGFKNLSVFIPNLSSRFSEDHLINRSRLSDLEHDIKIYHEPPDLSGLKNVVAIDALFGSGLHSPLKPEWAPWINAINLYPDIYSVDIPSGMLMDIPTPDGALAVKYTHVITFETVKRMFLFPESNVFVKSWEVVSIGWPWEELISNFSDVKEFIISDNLVKSIFQKRSRFSHKGTHGKCLIVAGSSRFPGAGVLCAGAAVRGGAGLTFVHSVPKVLDAVVSNFPECIPLEDNKGPFISDFPTGNFDALALGPGIGVCPETAGVLKKAIHSGIPMVLDADALNILSENPTWLHFLTPGTILTPHPLEFDRMFGRHATHYERWNKAKEMAIKLSVVIVLKGTHTVVCGPDGKSYFNVRGNAGLAKGGSGDVLCGLIASLLAQQYSPISASVLGVFVHSVAANLALENQSMESLKATDVIEKFGKVFQLINQ